MEFKNRYFLLRHGQTIYQSEKKSILYPWPKDDRVALTKFGKEQIKEAAKKLEGQGIDAIYASDLMRTRTTANIVAKVLGLKTHSDKRLRDIDFGIYHNKGKALYEKYFLNTEDRFTKRPPKGENWDDCIARLQSALSDIEKHYQGKNILIVSHGLPLWLLSHLIRNAGHEKLKKESAHGIKSVMPRLGALWTPQDY